jgi:hypothetical protein
MKHTGLFSRSFITACASVALGSGLVGCATEGVSEGLQNTHGKQVADADVMVTFSRGEIRLTCGFSCAGIAGSNKRAMKNLHYDQSWVDLARLVMKVGFSEDLSYYYLGRSAEGEGYIKAAKIYYQLALKNGYKCDSFINNCTGFAFPKDIQERLERISSNNLK